ncbi:MAG: methylaspartate mutase subunit S [Defluviitaleaceae bacterium]|nr:methylaspartate mutase subunit S [Defluviitaleaceae bacterium]
MDNNDKDKTHESEPLATLVLGVIGADVHAVGNKILNFVFTKAGFNVINLGVMVSQKEFVEAAVEADAHAIIVSSMYGHGEIDCKGLREKCDEAGLTDIKLYVGGNIVVGKQDFAQVEQTFKSMGYDRVYPPGTDPLLAIEHFKEDLGLN